MSWNSLNLSHLIAAGLGECCKMQDLSGEMWSRIINRNPACIDAMRKRVEKIRKMYPWLR